MGTLREQFRLDPEIAYLNHGGFGATPTPVLAAQRRLASRVESNPTAWFMGDIETELELALAQLAPSLGADAGDLAWTANATYGLNLIARSMMQRLHSGDEVLLTSLEYGSQVTLWDWVCRQTGATCRLIPLSGVISAEVAGVVEAHITPATRLVLFSHITSSTARRLPIEQATAGLRARGIVVVIDGAHAPGHIPLDLPALDCDYYVGNLHKWYAAPRPAAFIYASPQNQANLDPLVINWGGTDRRESLGHRTHLPGTTDATAWLSVPTAMAFHTEYLAPARAGARDLLAATAQALAELGYQPIGSQEDNLLMTAAWLPDSVDPETLAKQLKTDKVVAVVTQHEGRAILRIAIAWYTTKSETDRLLASCKKVAGAGGSS